MNTIKYGVIGVGSLGRHHARWAGMLEGVELVGVYDRLPERAAQVAAEQRCRAFPAAEALTEACDALSVAVTTSDHCDIALKVIEARRHLLVEKPIAATLEQADRMVAAAEAAGVILMVGHIERFNPAVTALAGYDLSPRFIEAHRLAAFNPRGADVAVVLDLMIHDIDLVLHLIKSAVERIDASAVAVVSDTVDIANARLTFANGAVANLTASRISLRPMRKLRIFQSSGYFSLDFTEKQADLYRMLAGAPQEDELAVPLGLSGRNLGYRKAGDKSQDMLQAELAAFVDAVRGNRPPAVTGREGRDALAVALAVIEQSRQASGRSEMHGR
ncbi:MAG: Gfo/Idh/MocA family oxidoreductase [candidate division Zixibacteria bacterium]|nr:Gfo/Idh/MocA family oxidoreductase [candidate division Zixibacteria bacterium]